MPQVVKADSYDTSLREPLNKSLPPRRGKVRMGVTALISQLTPLSFPSYYRFSP